MTRVSPGPNCSNPPTSPSADPTVAGTGQVIANDVATFIANSVSGGAITAYDISGAPVNIQLRWAKTASAPHGPPPTSGTCSIKPTRPPPAASAWQNVGIDYTFAPNGQMIPACRPWRYLPP